MRGCILGKEKPHRASTPTLEKSRGKFRLLHLPDSLYSEFKTLLTSSVQRLLEHEVKQNLVKEQRKGEGWVAPFRALGESSMPHTHPQWESDSLSERGKPPEQTITLSHSFFSLLKLQEEPKNEFPVWEQGNFPLWEQGTTLSPKEVWASLHTRPSAHILHSVAAELLNEKETCLKISTSIADR